MWEVQGPNLFREARPQAPPDASRGQVEGWGWLMPGFPAQAPPVASTHEEADGFPNLISNANLPIRSWEAGYSFS